MSAKKKAKDPKLRKAVGDAQEQRDNSAEKDLSKVPPELREHVFQPGQSGNPGGRPKGPSLTSLVNKHLYKQAKDKNGILQVDEEGNPVTYMHLLAEQIVKCAILGSSKHSAQIWDRTEGKVPDVIVGQIGVTGEITYVDISDDELAERSKSLFEALQADSANSSN